MHNKTDSVQRSAKNILFIGPLQMKFLSSSVHLAKRVPIEAGSKINMEEKQQDQVSLIRHSKNNAY